VTGNFKQIPLFTYTKYYLIFKVLNMSINA
jgi:hypothetical protein